MRGRRCRGPSSFAILSTGKRPKPRCHLYLCVISISKPPPARSQNGKSRFPLAPRRFTEIIQTHDVRVELKTLRRDFPRATIRLLWSNQVANGAEAMRIGVKISSLVSSIRQKHDHETALENCVKNAVLQTKTP